MAESKGKGGYGYVNVRSKVAGNNEEFFKQTLARVKKIQSHLQEAPRSGRLRDKVCIITGVGSLKGIGRASSLLFAHEGARHLYVGDFDDKNLPDLKSTIESKYPDVKVTTFQGDAAEEEVIVNVIKQAMQEEGRLDVFFANAGVSTILPLEETEPERFMETMRINALSCFIALKHASVAMQKTNPSRGKELSGGSIILTASVAGLRSGAGSLDYSASKAAVNNMAQTGPYQLRNTGVRVNSICPGLIETGMTEWTFSYAASRGTSGKIGQLNALGRYGVPQEIANLALFLASDDSSYVNGQNYACDGALSSSHPVAPGKWA